MSKKLEVGYSIRISAWNMMTAASKPQQNPITYEQLSHSWKMQNNRILT